MKIIKKNISRQVDTMKKNRIFFGRYYSQLIVERKIVRKR